MSATRRLIQALQKNDARAFDALRKEDEPSLDGAELAKLTVTAFDFGGVDVAGGSFDETLFERCTFSHSDCSGATFRNCTFLNCTFVNANLSSTAFDGCIIQGCVVRNCPLDESEMTGTTLDNTELEALEFVDVTWDAVTASQGAWRKLVGTSGEWSGVTLRDVVVTECAFEGLDLSRCMTNTDPVPAGFERLTGRRRTVR